MSGHWADHPARLGGSAKNLSMACSLALEAGGAAVNCKDSR